LSESCPTTIVARYSLLTAAGRKQLTAERQEFDRLMVAIDKVVSTA
jgi:hypothetical protein